MPLARPNDPPIQTVYVQGRVHTAPNFNDYVQTALLTANLVTQQETNNLLQQQATARKLDWWKSVVLNRYPGISDPMQIEDSALALMAWDLKEMRAGHRRYEGQHLPTRQTWEATFWKSVIAVFAAIFVPIICWFAILLVGIFLGTDPTKTFYASWAVSALVALVYIFWQVQASLNWATPNYDPTQDSELCRRFPPGSKIRDTSGEEYTVTGWPSYYAERLRFWYPVDHHSPRTTRDTDTGKPYLQSDVILWNDGVNNPIPGRVW